MALRHWIASVAVVAVTAAPALAQENNKHQRREQAQPRQEAQQPAPAPQPQAQQPQARQSDRAVPRAAAPAQQNVQRREDVQRRENVQPRADVQRRENIQPRVDVQRRENIQPRADVQRRENIQPRADVQQRENVQPRADVRQRDDAQRWERQNEGFRRDQNRHDVAVPRAYSYRNDVHRWDGGHYGEPLHYRYGYYAPRIVRPTIVQVIPYRPYVYRPSWSIGVYYGYDDYYPYGYTPPGYFDPIPGRYYGGVRITGAPRDARVFADGYFVGIVDDFDGVFQHMNLEAGPHHIDIQWGALQPVAFDVNVRPGETITFRADPLMFQQY